MNPRSRICFEASSACSYFELPEAVHIDGLCGSGVEHHAVRAGRDRLDPAAEPPTQRDIALLGLRLYEPTPLPVEVVRNAEVCLGSVVLGIEDDRAHQPRPMCLRARARGPMTSDVPVRRNRRGRP